MWKLNQKDFKVLRCLRCCIFEMIYTNSDGGARGNPGPGAIGIIVRKNGKILIKYSAKIGKFVTNNVAEYEALIKALELASKFAKDKITCNLDSELVVKQLLEVQKLQENFKSIKYKHVSRWDKFQQIVDELLNEELDRK